MAQPRRRRPVRIEIETENVEGRIDLAEILRKLERTAATQARAARRDPEIPPVVEERIRTVRRLANELADHIDELNRALPADRAPNGGGHGAT